MANSPDIWNAVNGLNQQGYEAALGAVPAHQTHPGGYGNMEAVHAHMVRLPSLPPFLPSRGHQRSKLVVHLIVCRTLTPRTRCWLLMSAGGSRPCPPSIATTWHHAPLRTPQVRKIHIYLFSGCFLRPILHVACCLCLFQSRGATEMRPEGHRQATPWAKLWPR